MSAKIIASKSLDAANAGLTSWLRRQPWFGEHLLALGYMGRFGWLREFHGPDAVAKAAADRHRAAQAEARDRRRAEQLDEDERLGIPREAAP